MRAWATRCAPRVFTCDPDTPMVTVAQRMAAEHVHAIVVL